MGAAMKRSNQPFFWLLFGAGGMLSALVGWMLVFVTGLAGPLGLGAAHAMDYARAAAFARSLPGKAVLFVVISLFLWHAAHRIYHSLHDIGLRAGTAAKLCCYGTALAGTLAALWALVAVGF
jgi:fumarate reductase subunit D